MNMLTRDVTRARIRLEQATPKDDRYRQGFHLMPPMGWLNNPCGFCQWGDTYHAFFQYSPFSVRPGAKFWGHATSKDLLTWTFVGTAVMPDQPFDCHGTYSGSAFVEDGVMTLAYTGNVLHEDARASFDYINDGRDSNTVVCHSVDGMDFGPKTVVLATGDYPADVTRHVRDPKIVRQGSHLLMLQGARHKRDFGEILVYESGTAGGPETDDWRLVNVIAPSAPFGYMWECPDYFELISDEDGDTHKVLSVSVRGLKGPEWDRRNVCQSGYFEFHGDLWGKCAISEGNYRLWDGGFDFYAPQILTAEDGRRLLVAWMGVPGCDAYWNKTVDAGWQNCLTLPRELSWGEDGRVLQVPCKEIEQLRRNGEIEADYLSRAGVRCFDLEVTGIRDNDCVVTIARELQLAFSDGRFEMRFADDSADAIGAGRGLRWEPAKGLRSLRVVGDASSVEVFVNDGELAFATRYYPEAYSIEVDAPGARIGLWDLAAKGETYVAR